MIKTKNPARRQDFRMRRESPDYLSGEPPVGSSPTSRFSNRDAINRCWVKTKNPARRQDFRMRRESPDYLSGEPPVGSSPTSRFFKIGMQATALKQKIPPKRQDSDDAEREGFEPPVGSSPTTVFKTVAINRSAISPGAKIEKMNASQSNELVCLKIISDWEMLLPEKIETNRLLIRRYKLDDAEIFFSALKRNQNHLKNWMWWAKMLPNQVEEVEKLINSFNQAFEANSDYTFGVFLKNSGSFIGSAGVHPTGILGIYEIGYWIDYAHVGLGYATELTKVLLEVGFDNILTLNEIQISCDATNKPSIRVAEKSGFKLIQTIKSHTPKGFEASRATLVYSRKRLKSEEE